MQTQSQRSEAAAVVKTERVDDGQSRPVVDKREREAATLELRAPDSACEPHIYELFMRLNRDEKVNQEANKAMFTTMSLNDCYRHVQSLNNDHFELIRREEKAMKVAKSLRPLDGDVASKKQSQGADPGTESNEE